MEKKRVVILGGGFGGLYAALYLQKELAEEGKAEVTLIDKHNFFTFTPLLPEVVAGNLGASTVTYPLRFLLRGNGVRVLQAEVSDFFLEEKQISVSGHTLPYDYLIIALGSVPDFFGNESLARVSLPLNSLTDALRIRNRVIRSFEEAGRERDEERLKTLLTLVVIGGGPSGVEVASEIHDLVHRVLLKYYPVNPALVRVVLIESNRRILTHSTPELAEHGQEILKKRGVEVRLNTRVTWAGEGFVELNRGEEVIAAGTLIWTAGTRAHPVLAKLPVAKTRRGTLVVDEYLKIPEYPEVFVVGDCACVLDRRRQRLYPPLAPVAIREGIRAAANISNDIHNRRREPFIFDFTGSIVSLGAKAALVNLLGLRLRGPLAWWIYRSAYLFRLVGVKNKCQLLLTLFLNAFFDRDISCWPEMRGPEGYGQVPAD
jgi:NADH dehydrogenase